MERKQRRWKSRTLKKQSFWAAANPCWVRVDNSITTEKAERCEHSRCLGASSALALVTGVCDRVCVGGWVWVSSCSGRKHSYYSLAVLMPLTIPHPQLRNADSLVTLCFVINVCGYFLYPWVNFSIITIFLGLVVTFSIHYLINGLLFFMNQWILYILMLGVYLMKNELKLKKYTDKLSTIIF